MLFDKKLIDDYYPKNYLFDLNLSQYETAVVGVDEAGRGALAGPVVIAGVIPDYNKPIKGVTDSKKLSAQRREELFEKIISHPNYRYHISIIEPSVIDDINILNATKKGMIECLEKLYEHYRIAIVDAVKLSVKDRILYPVIKADLKSASVGAASILAKVTRDRLIVELDGNYPGYGFVNNKGYPTKFHLEALKKIGASKIHRRSYSPVRKVIQEGNQPEFL
jgi:ribonuclease HII